MNRKSLSILVTSVVAISLILLYCGPGHSKYPPEKILISLKDLSVSCTSSSDSLYVFDQRDTIIGHLDLMPNQAEVDPIFSTFKHCFKGVDPGSTCNEPPPLGGSGSQWNSYSFKTNNKAEEASIFSITDEEDENYLLVFKDNSFTTSSDSFFTISLIDLPNEMDYESLYSYYSQNDLSGECSFYNLGCDFDLPFECKDFSLLGDSDFETPLGPEAKFVIDVSHNVPPDVDSNFKIVVMKTNDPNKVFRIAFRPISLIKDLLIFE